MAADYWNYWMESFRRWAISQLFDWCIVNGLPKAGVFGWIWRHAFAVLPRHRVIPIRFNPYVQWIPPVR